LITGLGLITLQNQVIEQVKVQWKHFSLDKSPWEIDDLMWEAYPFLFVG